MSESILNGKKILAVDDEPDVLAVLEEEIMDACPSCVLDKATTYESAVKLLESKPYDVVVLDIMGVRGFDLLDLAVKKDLKVAMLTAQNRPSGKGRWSVSRPVSVMKPITLMAVGRDVATRAVGITPRRLQSSLTCSVCCGSRRLARSNPILSRRSMTRITGRSSPAATAWR